MEDTRAPHIVVLPSPGIGHLIPLAEFAKRIISHHGFSVTFISVSADATSKTQKAVVDALPSNINSIALPPVSLSDLPQDAKIETRITLTVRRSIPALRDVVRSIQSSNRLVALVADLFATDAFDVAAEFGALPYVFYPTNAQALSLFFHLSKLEAKYLSSCEFRDVVEPIEIPGCIPMHGGDLLDPIQERSNEAYRCVSYHAERYKTLAKGVLVNTFEELEPGPIRAMKELVSTPVYPIGPLVRMERPNGVEDECPIIKWLDDQPQGSVLFVSFGSGGTLSTDQLEELALGLEMSEQRFLWVVRSPHGKAANGTYFTVESRDDPLRSLPQGFLSRTKGSSLVVPSWAPQVRVLGHRSTGGFLTHCGWNSTLESVVHGVPMIAWPLFAEQKMNAVMLTDGLKVAVRPKARENGLIGRDEIARVAKALMEGEEGKRLRHKMKELKDAASKALNEEGRGGGGGGSSAVALAQVCQEMMKAPTTNLSCM